MRGIVEVPSIQGAQTCDVETKPERQVQASNTVAIRSAHHGGRYVMVGQVLIKVF